MLEHAHNWQAADVGPTRMEQLEHEEIRNDLDRSGGVAQLGQQPPNSLFGPHRKRDVDHLDVPAPGLFDQLADRPHALADLGGHIRYAVRRPVVKEAGQLEAQMGRLFDVSRELKTQIVDAGDGKTARIEAFGPQQAVPGAARQAGSRQQNGGKYEPGQQCQRYELGRGLAKPIANPAQNDHQRQREGPRAERHKAIRARPTRLANCGTCR